MQSGLEFESRDEVQLGVPILVLVAEHFRNTGFDSRCRLVEGLKVV